MVTDNTVADKILWYVQHRAQNKKHPWNDKLS